EKYQQFRVTERHQKALQKKAAARRWGRLRLEALDGLADQLDAEPDEIGSSRKADPGGPVAHGRHQRGQPDRNDSDHDRQRRLDTCDIGQRGARTVAQAIGDDKRDDRSGQKRQRDAGGDESEIEFYGHRWASLTEALVAGFSLPTANLYRHSGMRR